MVDVSCVVGEKAAAKYAAIEDVKRSANADREASNAAFILFVDADKEMGGICEP